MSAPIKRLMLGNPPAGAVMKANLLCAASLLLVGLFPQATLAQFVTTFGSNGRDFGSGIAIDGAGNSYVTGGFWFTVDFDPGAGMTTRTSSGNNDVFVASYDATGAFRYVVAFGGTGADSGIDVAVDAAGNVYVTGRFSGTVDFDPGAGTENRTSNGGTDVFVASYDAMGAFRYVIAVGAGGTDEGQDIEVDAAGNVYITGTFGGTVDFDPGVATMSRTSNGDADVFVASYDATGAFRYATTFGTLSYDSGHGLAIDALGNVYVTGRFGSTSGDTADFDPSANTENRTTNGQADVFVASYDAFGAFRYATAFGGTQADIGYDVTVDASGNAHVTGVFSGVVDFDPGVGTSTRNESDGEAFVAGYDASGDFLSVFNFGSIVTFPLGVVLDGAGNLYVTGAFGFTADFDPGAGTEERTANSLNDLFVASYDASGALRHVTTLGDINDEIGSGIAVDATGSAFVAGSFTGTVDFDPGVGIASRSSNGLSDVFVLRLLPNGDLPIGLTADYTEVGDTGATADGTAQNAATAAIIDGDLDGSDTDADVFAVQFQAGSLTVSLCNDGGSSGIRDTQLFLFDSGGALVAENDDSGTCASGLISELTYVVPAAGTYYIGVCAFECTATGNTLTSDGTDGVAGDDYRISISGSALLPVELTTFTAALDGEQVALRWQTASETNNAGFEVERKRGGREEWTRLGFVEGRGTTTAPQAYRFTDTALPFEATLLVYRLKQIDFDGAFEYSPEVEVRLEAPTAFALEAAYPNPFNPTTTIRYALPAASQVKLAVYDVLGREVAVLLDGRQEAGRHAVVWEAGSLPSGVYFYRIEAGQFTQARRVVLLK